MIVSKKPETYAEPFPASKLVENSVYYMATYFDDDLLIPEIKTLVFLGKDTEGKKSDSYYFQDYASYKDVGAFPHNEDGCGEVFILPEKGLINIRNLSGVIAFLCGCAERTRQA